jgi:hypothetical protein
MSDAMGHYRLASKAAGDDTTRARYVRTNRDETEHGRKRRQNRPRPPGFEASFIQEGRTKFARSVKPVSAFAHLLVSGHNNIKIGRDVRKGHLRGYWIYTLSLEERKTCPSSCQHWQTCYGNNMPFAKRIDHTDPQFLPLLEAEIAELCVPPAHARGKKAARTGVLIRLHALGDFYSYEYVEFWGRMLRQFPNLSIYGYTGRDFLSVIGARIQRINIEFGARCMVRFSNGGLETMSTVSIGSVESCPPNAFICPEQTGGTLGCDHCGACWATKKNVAFLEH